MTRSTKIKLIVFGVICIMLGYFIAMAQRPDAAASQLFTESSKELEHSQFHNVYKAVIPAVVNISSESSVTVNDPFYDMFRRFYGEDGRQPQRQRKETQLGSGFIINDDGYIVTNSHVISRADSIKVILADGEEYPAEVIGADTRMDVAVIKINAKKKLPYIVLGDSDKIEVGDWSIAIGNPFGLERTLTVGVISAKGRPVRNSMDALIQTDTAINPGNSGGPLLNINGEVVGINTMIIGGQAQNIGFAIPINVAKRIIRELIQKGSVDVAYLGIEMEDVDEQMKETLGLKIDEGVVIRGVMESSPAEKAGLNVGDIIFEIDGKKVKNREDLAAIVQNTPPGTTIRIKLLRSNRERTITAVLAVRKDEGNRIRRPDKDNPIDTLGITVADAEKGVEVTSVSRNSLAYGALREGDVILSVNNTIIENSKEFKTIMEKMKNRQALYFIIIRDGRQMFLQIRNR